jgi:hypothetical protein
VCDEFFKLLIDAPTNMLCAMNYDDVIKFWKTQQGAADAIGVSQASVCRWRRGGIPLDKQFIIEVITGGKLKADRRIKRPRAAAVPA